MTGLEMLADLKDKLYGYFNLWRNNGDRWNGDAPSGYKLRGYAVEIGAAMLDMRDGTRAELLDVLSGCIDHFDAGAPLGDLERRCKALVVLLGEVHSDEDRRG